MTHEFEAMMEDMHEELDGAHHYAELWHRYRDRDPANADAFRDMAEQELSHAHRFMDMGDQIAKKDTMTEADKAVWHWERGKAERMHTKIKGMLCM